MDFKKVLRKGITGFVNSCYDVDTFNFNSINYKLFKKRCHQLANNMGGNVLYIDSDVYQEVRSFRIVKIGNVNLPFGGDSFEVLINSHYPIAALAKEREEGNLELCFIDLEEAKDLFKDHFLLLSKEDLEQKFDYMSKELDYILYEAEIEQIRYWEPKRLGEVIFNYWD